MSANNFSFINHSKCEYFPCHKGVNEEEFNCLFCYCPLFLLGEDCGGNFTYLSSGVKDCTNCNIPHSKNGFDYIQNKFPEILCKLMENK